MAISPSATGSRHAGARQGAPTEREASPRSVLFEATRLKGLLIQAEVEAWYIMDEGTPTGDFGRHGALATRCGHPKKIARGAMVYVDPLLDGAVTPPRATAAPEWLLGAMPGPSRCRLGAADANNFRSHSRRRRRA